MKKQINLFPSEEVLGLPSNKPDFLAESGKGRGQKLNTDWLNAPSFWGITDQDMIVRMPNSRVANGIELKKRVPFMTALQLAMFRSTFNVPPSHVVVVHNNSDETGDFEADSYTIFCPFSQTMKAPWNEYRRSYRLDDRNRIMIDKAHARPILIGADPFPCCRKYSYEVSNPITVGSYVKRIQELEARIQELEAKLALARV